MYEEDNDLVADQVSVEEIECLAEKEAKVKENQKSTIYNFGIPMQSVYKNSNIYNCLYKNFNNLLFSNPPTCGTASYLQASPFLYHLL